MAIVRIAVTNVRETTAPVIVKFAVLSDVTKLALPSLRSSSLEDAVGVGMIGFVLTIEFEGETCETATSIVVDCSGGRL